VFASATATTSTYATRSTSASFHIGGQASAHVTASAGAFAALGPPRPRTRGSLDVSRVFGAQPRSARPVDSPTGFGPGGRALHAGSGVDVGQRISVRDRIEFEE
jgi:hypothetical protein